MLLYLCLRERVSAVVSDRGSEKESSIGRDINREKEIVLLYV